MTLIMYLKTSLLRRLSWISCLAEASNGGFVGARGSLIDPRERNIFLSSNLEGSFASKGAEIT